MHPPPAAFWGTAVRLVARIKTTRAPSIDGGVVMGETIKRRLARGPYVRFEPAEDAVILEMYAWAEPAAILARLPGRDWKSVGDRAKVLRWHAPEDVVQALRRPRNGPAKTPERAPGRPRRRTKAVVSAREAEGQRLARAARREADLAARDGVGRHASVWAMAAAVSASVAAAASVEA